MFYLISVLGSEINKCLRFRVVCLQHGDEMNEMKILTLNKYRKGQRKRYTCQCCITCIPYFRQFRGPGGDIRATLAPFTELSCTSEM